MGSSQSRLSASAHLANAAMRGSSLTFGVRDTPVPKRARARVPDDLLPLDRCCGCRSAELARVRVRSVVEVDVAAVDPVRALPRKVVRAGVAAGPKGEASAVATCAASSVM